MIDEISLWINKDIKTNIVMFTVFAGLTGAIVGGFFTTIFWPSIKELLISLFRSASIKISSRTLEEEYLLWLTHEHENLPVLPTTLVSAIENQHIQEMDRMYVSLTFSGDDSLLKGIESSQTIEQIIQTIDKLIVLGDPGSGKTTLLRFLALNFARARLWDMYKFKSQFDNKFAKSTELIKKQYLFKNVPFPIFLYLNRFTNRDINNTNLLSILYDDIRSIPSCKHIPDGFFEAKLKTEKCIVILDGFDEVGNQKIKHKLVNEIGGLVKSYNEGNKFIVSSRVVGYDGQLLDVGFKVRMIEHLKRTQIESLVTKWHKIIGTPELTDKLLITILNNPSVMDLCINPMLLSLIVLVQYVKKIIPEKRHILYDECIKILIERRYAHPDVQIRYNKVITADEVEHVLTGVAEYFHYSHKRELPRDELEKMILPAIIKEIPRFASDDIDVVNILNNIEERCQLLYERGTSDTGEPLMAFSHLTFQEYFVSLSFVNKMQKEGLKSIMDESLSLYMNNPKWWKEVVLLFSARLPEGSKNDFLEKLLANM